MSRGCRIRDHIWEKTKSTKYERCQLCSEFFPCKFECGHFDCILTRAGRGHEIDPDIKLPGWPLKEDPFAKAKTEEEADPEGA